jgi:polyadenylate-binding protein
LYIKNIEDEIDEERLRKEFSAFGSIKSCKIMLDEKNISKGFGFVCFSTPEESQRAIAEMNSRILPGCQKPLYVAMHEPKEVRRQKLTLNAYKGMRAAIPQGAPGAPISYPPGQTVYYQGGNISQGFVYPQQMMQSMPRGWQPQYPVPPYSNNVGVIPARGGAAAASNRGRGAGSTRGGAAGAGGGGRGGANRRGQQVAQVTDAQTGPVETPLSIAQVKQYPLEQQKLYIGERLYALISPAQPILAGKITGMFLESGWPIDELYSLLTDEGKLAEKIDDAISVLERAQQGQLEGEEGGAEHAEEGH